MRTTILSLAAVAVLTGAPAAFAQDTTIVHKDEHGDRSKTVVKRDDGSKAVIKRHGDKEKKVYTSPAGDKTVIKKRTDPDLDR
jgi:hypothetical protein